MFQSARELLWNVVKHANTDRAVLSLNTSFPACFRISLQDRGRGFKNTPIESVVAGQCFGLFSIRERIKAMGGKMSIETAAGKGTCITMEIAYATASSVKPTMMTSARSFPEPKQSPSTESLRILLVDDHAMVRQGLRSILASYPGLEVIGEAKNGEEALTFAVDKSPDIILMDINMPTMDGITATKRVKDILPSTVVIGLSVNQSPHIVEAMTAAGASAFVSKEMAGDDLFATIMSVVEPTRG